MDKTIEERIGEGLVRRGALQSAQVDEILTIQKNGDKRLFGEIALDLGYIKVRSLIDYLREKED